MGWKKLAELISEAKSSRDKAFIASLFLTGGRVSEVLQLKRENFEVRKEEGLILVRAMPKLKQYKKLGSYVDEGGRNRWETERIIGYRKTFPILLAEPLSPILIEWIEKSDNYLFKSPYNDGPLSRVWAYCLLRELGDPDNLKLWPHRFRAERASQLADDYGYEVLDLKEYFGWAKLEQAAHYASRGWRGLASKMRVIKYV
jgi:integrase